ncbi:hypothetical protein AAC387_Pa01g4249 [Persea americana]
MEIGSEPVFEQLGMNASPSVDGAEVSAGFQNEGKGVGIWKDGALEHLGEEEEGLVGSRNSDVAADHGVPGEDIWAVDAGEDGEGVVHGAHRGEAYGGEELADVALVLGLDHVGVDLLEMFGGLALVE